MFAVSIEDKFSAAHLLRDYKGKCAQLHGHNWKVTVKVHVDKLDDIGIAIDFHELKSITKEVMDELDHKNLNDLDFFSYHNPSSENIARFIFQKIQDQLPVYVKLDEVAVVESEGCTIRYSEKIHENQ